MKDDEMLPPTKHERWWDVAPYQTWKKRSLITSI